MSLQPGAMLWNSLEIFDNNRLYTNMAAAFAAGDLPSQFRLSAGAEADCNGIGFVGSSPWLSSWEESEEFLGFMVYEIKGMDGAHYSRPTAPRLSYPFGSTIGRLMPTHRTISFDFAAVATTERGLNYGMEWLERQVRKSAPAFGCTDCALSEMTLWSSNPGVPVPDGNVQWTFFNSGLMEGPVWTERLTDQTGRFARLGNMAIAVGDPCRYSQREVVAFNQPLDVTNPIVASCETVTDDTDGLYDTYPIVQILAGASPSPPIEVAVWSDPGSSCCPGPPSSYASLAYFTVKALPANATLEIDFARRTVQLLTVPPQDGSNYIDASGGLIDWGSLACASSLCVRIRATTPGNATSYSVYSVQRAGC